MPLTLWLKLIASETLDTGPSEFSYTTVLKLPLLWVAPARVTVALAALTFTGARVAARGNGVR